MRVIFLDGESKSGKTAVGRSILTALSQDGHTARLLVAGNFFRQLTVLALELLGGNASASQSEFEAAVHRALGSEALLLPPADLGALESPAVEANVSRVGQLAFVQEAAADWRTQAAQKAQEDGMEILLFDGRNLRDKLRDWTHSSNVAVLLELVIYCRPEVAAARYLYDEHIANPAADDLARAAQAIEKRRQDDRNRSHAAYVEPVDPVPLVVGTDSITAALEASWNTSVTNPPRPIRFDNSEVPRDDGLRTVTELARAAVAYQIN